jgi:hypothetical protein
LKEKHVKFCGAKRKAMIPEEIGCVLISSGIKYGSSKNSE